ncbi:MAG: CoA pyrophosphatase [Polyangiales bacterium]
MTALVTPDRVRLALASRDRDALEGPEPRAAVLVPLLSRGGEPSVLLTRRASHLRHHAGQYAFPGGRSDPGDLDAVSTALREAREEVGLAPEAVDVLGLLDDQPTTSRFVVTPVVGWIPHPYAYTVSDAEVALAVELPLAPFLEAPASRAMEFEGRPREVLAYEVDGHFVWGATARMLRGLALALR